MRNTVAEVFRFCLTAFFLFCFFSLNAQVSTDSIPMGVISVKRPPVTASYRVTLQYFNPEIAQKHITEFSAKQIVFSDSLFNPSDPQPFEMYFTKDSVAIDDSLREHSLSAIKSIPSSPFNWNNFLKAMHWQFEWTDSAKSDSARYEFSIDKKGKASVKLLPWKNENSAQKAFEKRGMLYMGLLTQWYPAKLVKRTDKSRKKTKYKDIASVVIITIYAYDPNEGRLLPIESQIIPK